MPSPLDDRPGLLMRDPFRYSEQTVIVPPLLARALPLFDGEHTDLDLRAYLTEATGELEVSEVANHFLETLEQGGFLESDTFFALRDAKHKAFHDAPEKLPAHAGAAYPDEPEALGAQLRQWGAEMNGGGEGRLVGLAAPHVSPEGGYESYAAAYNRLRPEHASKTFVILGTSHYGESETWGLTRKPYSTPLGVLETDQAIVDRLATHARGLDRRHRQAGAASPFQRPRLRLLRRRALLPRLRRPSRPRLRRSPSALDLDPDRMDMAARGFAGGTAAASRTARRRIRPGCGHAGSGARRTRPGADLDGRGGGAGAGQSRSLRLLLDERRRRPRVDGRVRRGRQGAARWHCGRLGRARGAPRHRFAEQDQRPVARRRAAGGSPGYAAPARPPTSWPWIAGALAAFVFLPHVLWQIAHDWPTVEFIRVATTQKMLPVSPLDLFAQQILVWNPLVFPCGWPAALRWCGALRATPAGCSRPSLLRRQRS